MLSVSNKPIVIDNADLCNKVLCSSDKISCIANLCRKCQEFKKLDELSIENLHCSKKCMIDQINCTAKTNTIKVNLFERNDYLHKDNKKKKIQLVKKDVTPKLFVAVPKEKLKGFACHRFNVSHTNYTFDQAVAGMSDETIIKIQSLSKIYTCLLPEEITSIHWTQEKATVYLVVVLRKVDGILHENHFAFISNDLTLLCSFY